VERLPSIASCVVYGVVSPTIEYFSPFAGYEKAGKQVVVVTQRASQTLKA